MLITAGSHDLKQTANQTLRSSHPVTFLSNDFFVTTWEKHSLARQHVFLDVTITWVVPWRKERWIQMRTLLILPKTILLKGKWKWGCDWSLKDSEENQVFPISSVILLLLDVTRCTAATFIYSFVCNKVRKADIMSARLPWIANILCPVADNIAWKSVLYGTNANVEGVVIL